MSNHLGTVGAKISAEVTLVNEYSFTDYKFSYHGTTHYIYTMHDPEGNVLVWKTTNPLVLGYDGDLDCIRKGDTMRISGTVKEHGEYKGTKQTVLTRCKFDLVAHKVYDSAPKRAEQLKTLEEGDFVWEMPYRQYKAHYSDCETLCGSYEDYDGLFPATIKVIIRKGRLKASGVRGQRFSGYSFLTSNGGYTATFRAVSEENARKQAKKAYEDYSDSWDLYRIYQ